MAGEMPAVPAGSGKHPIPLVVLSASKLTDSTAFYSRVFGWHGQPISAELTAVVTASGPALSLRSNNPEGFPGVVPFIRVPDVEVALAQVVAAGGSVERATWSVPVVGPLARFKDPSGTIYGLTSIVPPGDLPSVPQPLGTNPKPPEGTVCSLEMYAADGAAAARWFDGLFGWGSRETMANYMAFDPGRGVGGVFQSHTPGLTAVAYVYVADVGRTLDAIEAAGGARTGDAMAIPGIGCFGYFKDPSGTQMGLIGP